MNRLSNLNIRSALKCVITRLIFIHSIFLLSVVAIASEQADIQQALVGGEVKQTLSGDKKKIYSLEQTILHDIKLSQVQLAQLQEQVAQHKKLAALEVSELERSVFKLQKELKGKQEVASQSSTKMATDANNIKALEKDLTYIANNISAYLTDDNDLLSAVKPSAVNNSNALSIVTELDGLTDLLELLDERLKPVFKPSMVVNAEGRLQNRDVLSLGPNHYFTDGNLTAGTARFEAGVFKQVNDFPKDERLSLLALQKDGFAELTFDPTLGQLEKLTQAKEGVVEHVQKGGVWALPIIIFAVVALLIALLKAFQLFRLPAVKVLQSNNVAQLYASSTVFKAGMGKLQRGLFDVALSEASKQARDDKLFVLLDQYKYQLTKWISLVAITAAIAPLLGLLGTVSGMIETFKMMTLFGAGDPSVISGGISQALITTELGLLVAIPALILNAVLTRKANRYYQELENFALLLGQGDLFAREDIKVNDAHNKAVS